MGVFIAALFILLSILWISVILGAVSLHDNTIEDDLEQERSLREWMQKHHQTKVQDKPDRSWNM